MSLAQKVISLVQLKENTDLESTSNSKATFSMWV